MGVFLPIGIAVAQTNSASVAAFSEGFRPVPGGKPDTEEVNASMLVIAAYAAFALGFVGYLSYLARAQSRMAKDIQELGARLDGRQQPADKQAL